MRALILSIIICPPFSVFPQTLSDLYQRVKSTVVVIETETEISTENGQVTYAGTQGSGVLISQEGEIVTAAHVIADAEQISVIFHDGEVYPAEVVRMSKVADVALIKLSYTTAQSRNYPVAKFGDSDQVRVGDDIFIIGAPFGLDYSLSRGIVSGVSKEKSRMAGFTFAEFFQTDAAINQGNSGGPMFNIDGEVIGIVSYIVSESGGFDGIGFAATSNITEFIVVDSKRRWTGINGILLDPGLARALNVAQAGGILVQQVTPLSPAFIGGLQGGEHFLYYQDREIRIGGDIILEVNGVRITDEKSIGHLIRWILLSSEEERKIYELTVLRAGKVKTLTLRLQN